MMSPPPPLNERSHQASSSSTAVPPYSSAGRRNMYGASRQPLYSSLGDALGGSGMHQPQQQQHSTGNGPAGSEYSVSSGSAHPPPPLPPPPTHHPHITPDGRTQYTPSGLPSYEYPYQSGSYAEPISQYGHSSLPPMRTASPAASYATLNQPIAQYNTHSAPYTPAYSQPPYILTDKEWTQSPQGFAAEAVPPMFVAGRSDVSASPQVDQRSYVQPQYTPPPANVHPEERSFSGELSPSSKGKTRDHETGRTYRSPSSSFGSSVRDFNKLSSTYGQLYAECSAIGQRGLPGTPESLDEIDGMLRSAKIGLHLLQPAFVPANSAPHRRSSEESRNSAELENASPELPAKRQAESATAPDGQKCLGCGATATPEWRRGPLGPRTLCNACGLVYAKMIKKRGRDTRPNTGNPSNRAQNRTARAQTMVDEAPSLDSPGDHSDDELSYGSQDPN